MRWRTRQRHGLPGKRPSCPLRPALTLKGVIQPLPCSAFRTAACTRLHETLNGETRMFREEVRFEVLGPLRGWQGGAEIDLGSPQQRAVLAMLLLARGRQVSLKGLINGLWERDVPRAA